MSLNIVTRRFFTQLEKMPNFHCDISNCMSAYEHYYKQNFKELENDLLPELWNIVFSFLDYTQPMQLSLPLDEFTLQSEVADENGVWQPSRAVPQNTRPLTHICGRSDGGTFQIRTSLTTYTFCGNPEISLVDFFFSGLHVLDDPETHYVIQLSFGLPHNTLLPPGLLQEDKRKYWVQEQNNVRKIPFEEIERCGIRPVYEISNGYDRVILF